MFEVFDFGKMGRSLSLSWKYELADNAKSRKEILRKHFSIYLSLVQCGSCNHWWSRTCTYVRRPILMKNRVSFFDIFDNSKFGSACRKTKTQNFDSSKSALI